MKIRSSKDFITIKDQVHEASCGRRRKNSPEGREGSLIALT
jgi:hypothetical protein